MQKRYTSLDVFRGLTIGAMILVNTPGSWANIYPPLAHADWHGYTPTDLVFPFFLVAVGLSMSFSFEKFREAKGSLFFTKTIRRAIIIFLIGLALTAFPFIGKDYSQLRILGVLQRIALAYLLASIVVYYIKSTKHLLVFSSLLLFLYWFVLVVFGHEDPFGLEGNLPRIIDLALIGDAHMWHGKKIAFDPEGLLSTFPAAITVISGYLFGRLIKSTSEQDLLAKLLLASTALIGLGYSWSLFFPINKALWTSSYVLVSSGIAGVILAQLIYLIDVRHWHQWSKPFEVFGLNPLISFVLSILWVKIYFLIKIDGQNMYGWLYTEVYKGIINPTFGSLLFAITHVIGVWLIAYFLYRKRIIIKI